MEPALSSGPGLERWQQKRLLRPLRRTLSLSKPWVLCLRVWRRHIPLEGSPEDALLLQVPEKERRSAGGGMGSGKGARTLSQALRGWGGDEATALRRPPGVADWTWGGAPPALLPGSPAPCSVPRGARGPGGPHSLAPSGT